MPLAIFAVTTLGNSQVLAVFVNLAEARGFSRAYAKSTNLIYTISMGYLGEPDSMTILEHIEPIKAHL